MKTTFTKDEITKYWCLTQNEYWVKKYKYNVEKVITDERTGTKATILSRDNETIILFHGTDYIGAKTDFFELLKDIITDIMALPTEVKVPNKILKIHTGFYNAFNAISNSLTYYLLDKYSVLLKDKNLIFLGHSLGGAIAQVAITISNSFKFVNCSSVIFGSPKIGDKQYQILSKDLPILNFVHRGDPIPKLPPFFLGYKSPKFKTIFLGKKGLNTKAHQNYDEYFDELPEELSYDLLGGEGGKAINSIRLCK